MTRDIRPGDKIMVTQRPANPIWIATPLDLVPVQVVLGLKGTALIPTDDGDGWVIDFPPFGEAAVPTKWLLSQ